MFWSRGSYNDLQLVLLNLYTVVLIAYHLNYHLLPIITLITTYHQLSDYLSVAFITSYTAFILLTHSVHKLFGGKIGVQRTPWTRGTCSYPQTFISMFTLPHDHLFTNIHCTLLEQSPILTAEKQ